MISAVLSVEPSSTMTHRSGGLVWAQTDSSVLSMKAASLCAGVMRMYFTATGQSVAHPLSSKLRRGRQRAEDRSQSSKDSFLCAMRWGWQFASLRRVDLCKNFIHNPGSQDYF